ncbi:MULTISPECIES: ABC transporter substrate-binding protein [unclassified Frondihabitans]|uniref:ABC transporter substrate-binding protein n=1 Tax=unclassified Frondihabitans TaxID=2626248 RepID=UPI000F4E9CC5|nr:MULTISPECIES: ABC transporter substrate-binding protein [unclassified Frondihabitans]RPE74329.1 polar amino acid transport system substrate-binding protein [Frondihabitans sp. PhB153]RPF02758.1 polar amino acid transport system substrate-binding protein [Frondihabitans sp. PhB161]
MTRLSPRSSPRTSRRVSRRTAALAGAAALLAAVALTACSSGGGGNGGNGSSDTVTVGKLTIATGQPAYSPWIDDNKPESGKGFESAVAYAVADELGYKKSDVVWTRSTFDSAIAPGAKDWDLNIQQFSITAQREKAVDFSPVYYTTTQAVVTTSKSAAAGVTDIAGLKGLKVGVATGTTSLTVAKDELGTTPQVFNSNDDAVLALKSGQIDAVVTDLPTAFYMSSAQLDDGKIIGQFADDGNGDKFGIVLPKGSALTNKVKTAVDTLKSDGTLEALTKKWLSTEVDVPILK